MSATAAKAAVGNNSETALATTSARFVSMVERQFAAEMGTALAWTDYQKTLAQHLFLRVDSQLQALEAKRLDGNRDGTPITWANVNVAKLALDGVHRVSLGLDALVPNHIHPIPYFNKRIKKYDLDLRVGYAGKLFCRQTLSVDQVVDVICHLVYETDEFVPHFRSVANEIESYEFRVTKPFERGKVVGGFGYVVYEDPRKNRLVLVSERDFAKAEAGARSKDFWGDDKWREEMMLKTVIHRVADKIALDPRKVNAPSYAYIQAQEDAAEEVAFRAEVDERANQEAIDAEWSEIPPEAEATPEQQPEATQVAEKPPAAKAAAKKTQEPDF